MNARWLHSHRILVASLVAAMLAVGLLTLLVIRQQQDQASQVYLEAGGSLGAHPFVPLLPPVPPTDGSPADAGAAVQAAAGSDGRASTYSERLISYLETHPHEATAWAQALNSDPTLSWSGGNRVDVQQIPAYIRELAPRALAEDLGVTDYQFVNGKAIAVQSILQKGSAVLVDAKGTSRVRCLSGNPLAPMIRLKVPPIYRGTRWLDFQPQRVIVAQRGVQCAHDEYYDGERCRQIAGCPHGEYRGDGGQCYNPDQRGRLAARGLSDEPKQTDHGRQSNQAKRVDQVTRPDQPNRAAQVTRPDQMRSDQPKQAERQEQIDQPKQAEQPQQARQPEQAEQPEQARQPEQAEQAQQPEQAEQARQPEQAEQPTRAEQPTQADPPKKAEQPKKADQPVQQEQSAQPNKPGRPSEPVQQNQPKQEDKPGRPDGQR